MILHGSVCSISRTETIKMAIRMKRQGPFLCDNVGEKVTSNNAARDMTKRPHSCRNSLISNRGGVLAKNPLRFFLKQKWETQWSFPTYKQGVVVSNCLVSWRFSHPVRRKHIRSLCKKRSEKGEKNLKRAISMVAKKLNLEANAFQWIRKILFRYRKWLGA